MQMRRWKLAVPVVFLTVLAIACQDAPVAPGSLTVGPSFAKNGNAFAARQCQQGGYLHLFRTDGTGFANAGDCVSYAAQGGLLARRLTASFFDVRYDACNQLSWGVELDGVIQGPLGQKAYGCEFLADRDTSVDYLSTQSLRVYLRDETCSGWTYFEDGNHAIVLRNPTRDTVTISDAGGFCESPPGDPRPPTGGANLFVIRTVTGS